MEAGKWQSPGIKSDSMEKKEGMFLKPKKGEGDSNPSSGIDQFMVPGIGKEGSGNKELNQRPQPESEASSRPGLIRWGDPEIVLNSAESEIYCDPSERYQSLEGLSEEEAEDKRMHFNAGALSIQPEDNGLLIQNRHASDEDDRETLDSSK